MVNTQELVQTNTGTTLTQWAAKALAVTEENIHLRFRGNTLHILWESDRCPSMAIAVSRLTDALKKQGIDSLLPPDHPPIDEIFLYGRTLGTKRPDWSVRIESTHPNSSALKGSPRSKTKRSTAEVKPTQTPPPPPPPPTENLPFSIADARMMLKVQSRASLGNPEAEVLLAKGMARYLTETLSLYSISLKVLIRPLKRAERTWGDRPYPPRRLWIFCQSPNYPDATPLALPIAERLRELQLTGCTDAAILGRTTPDGKPELLLRVDLTPTVERLKTWAKWGDIPAITRLLNQAVASKGLEIGAVQKDATLHLFCGNSAPDSEATDSPLAAADKSLCIDAIAPLLKSLSPQGLHAVTLYGCRDGRQLDTPSNAPPLWVDWLDLPAARNPLLALSPRELATQGNLDALQFLLDRLVNPELDAKLNGTGLSVFLRQDPDLLHIMVEGSTCPDQDTLAPLILEFLQELNLNGVEQLRLYGRRGGDKQPSWRYHTAIFPPSSLLPPEPEAPLAIPEDPTPEPPATSEPDEIASDTPEPAIAFTHGEPDATEDLPEAVESMFASDPPEELQACLTKQVIPLAPRERPSPGWVTRLFLVTGLFIPAKTFRRGPASSSKVAFIWGFLGLLVMLQTDWLLGSAALFPVSSPGLETATVSGEPQADPSVLPLQRPEDRLGLGELSLNPSAKDEDPIFNGSSFTELEEDPAIAVNPETLPTFDYPTFNSQQLDEQLRLYLQYLATSGPPDVLIIGSSRALRGVAPMTIEESLSSRYPGLKVFNFGINGATAQVADFVVRELIPQEQLPKLILWADGARALNSGRSDRTFEAISRSPGYRHLLQGNRPQIPELAKRDDEASQSLSSLSETLVQRARTGLNVKESYEKLDLWINEKLASVSANYEHRDRLQGFLRGQLLLPLADIANHFIPEPSRPPEEAIAEIPAETTTDSTFDSVEESLIALSEESAALSGPDTLQSATLSNGFLPLSVRFNPMTYYEKHARVSGDYDADYESFQLAGIQTAAVTNLLAFTREHQIPLVFINMPLTQEYLDPVRLEYEREFQTYMLSLSLEKEGLSFRDLSQLWPTEIDRFSDPSHLNRYGAHEVSNRLSQDPMIPWPQTQ